VARPPLEYQQSRLQKTTNKKGRSIAHTSEPKDTAQATDATQEHIGQYRKPHNTLRHLPPSAALHHYQLRKEASTRGCELVAQPNIAAWLFSLAFANYGCANDKYVGLLHEVLRKVVSVRLRYHFTSSIVRSFWPLYGDTLEAWGAFQLLRSHSRRLQASAVVRNKCTINLDRTNQKALASTETKSNNKLCRAYDGTNNLLVLHNRRLKPP